MTNTNKNNPAEGKSSSFFMIIAIIIAMFVAGGYLVINKDSIFPDKRLAQWEVSYVENTDTGSYIQWQKKDGHDGKIIDNYSDPQCPYCAMFESVNHDSIIEAVDAGNVFRYHPMTFLDKSHQNDYSIRNTETIVALAKTGDAQASWRFYEDMWDVQDIIKSRGNATNEDLAKVAKDVGSPKEIVDVAKNATGENVTDGDVNIAYLRGIMESVGTPAIFVDGEFLTDPISSTVQFRNAVGL